MTKIRPFDKGFFVIHNAVFDIMMPTLNPNSFKVLCVAIRQTLGWNRDSDMISYSQFKEKSGIKSDATVSNAIKENLKKGYLVRVEAKSNGNIKASFYYRLNSTLEIEVEENSSTSKVEVEPTSKVEVEPTSKVEDTTIQEHNNRHDVDADNKQLQLEASYNPKAFNALVEFGVECNVARTLSENTDCETVSAWIEYTQNHNLDNPQGFVVSRLKLGKRPPKAVKQEKQREYVACPECYQLTYYEHICPGCGKCRACCEC